MKSKFWFGLSFISLEFLSILIFLLCWFINQISNISYNVLAFTAGVFIIVGLNILALVCIFSD